MWTWRRPSLSASPAWERPLPAVCMYHSFDTTDASAKAGMRTLQDLLDTESIAVKPKVKNYVKLLDVLNRGVPRAEVDEYREHLAAAFRNSQPKCRLTVKHDADRSELHHRGIISPRRKLLDVNQGARLARVRPLPPAYSLMPARSSAQGRKHISCKRCGVHWSTTASSNSRTCSRADLTRPLSI